MVDLHHNKLILEYQNPLRVHPTRDFAHQPPLRSHAYSHVPLHLLLAR